MACPIEVLKELSERCAEEFSFGRLTTFLSVDRLGIAIRSTDETSSGQIVQMRRIIPWSDLEYDLIAHKILEDTVEEVVRTRINADRKPA